jgi:hypothetical protein
MSEHTADNDAGLTPYYSDDFVTLYHGDCREVTAWLDADVLATDPPYGIAHRSGGGPRGEASWRNSTIANDCDTAVRDDVLTLWGDRPAIVFGSWRRSRPDRTRALLIWDKGLAAGMGDLTIPWKPNHEEVYVIGEGFHGARDSGVLTGHNIISWESSGRSHPHEKPLSLMVSLLGKCPDGVVADPFAGSGTTLVATKFMGRRAIGIELEERYCETAARRLAQDTIPFVATKRNRTTADIYKDGGHP